MMGWVSVDEVPVYIKDIEKNRRSIVDFSVIFIEESHLQQVAHHTHTRRHKTFIS